MEWINGVRCTDTEALLKIGVPVSKFIEVGVESQTRQLLEFGLFHGDPHPGNIFALADGRIAYVDFGSVAELTLFDKETLVDCVVFAMDEDFLGIAGLKRIARARTHTHTNTHTHTHTNTHTNTHTHTHRSDVAAGLYNAGHRPKAHRPRAREDVARRCRQRHARLQPPYRYAGVFEACVCVSNSRPRALCARHSHPLDPG
jgi:hypothetical protein